MRNIISSPELLNNLSFFFSVIEKYPILRYFDSINLLCESNIDSVTFYLKVKYLYNIKTFIICFYTNSIYSPDRIYLR